MPSKSLIAGFAIWCIGGAGHLSAAGFGAHHIDYAAKTVATFEAGQTPHVVISDPESRVYVNVSSDGQVHVKDNTSIHGMIFSTDRSIPETERDAHRRRGAGGAPRL